jgi:hypothetical protein
MTKLDSRLREALMAAHDLSGAADAPHGAGDSTRGRQLPQSTRVRALVADQLVSMGFDATANWPRNGPRATAAWKSSRRKRSPSPVCGPTPWAAWSMPSVQRWAG